MLQFEERLKMGLFDNFYIEKNTFVFPEHFIEKYIDFPLSKEKGNLELYYQSKDINYRDEEIHKQFCKTAGYEIYSGLHYLSIFYDKDNLLKIYWRDGNTHVSEPLKPYLFLEWLDIDFEILYISNCQDLTSYQFESTNSPNLIVMINDESKLDKIKDTYYKKMEYQYGRMEVCINIEKGIVKKYYIREYDAPNILICNLLPSYDL